MGCEGRQEKEPPVLLERPFSLHRRKEKAQHETGIGLDWAGMCPENSLESVCFSRSCRNDSDLFISTKELKEEAGF